MRLGEVQWKNDLEMKQQGIGGLGIVLNVFTLLICNKESN